jgi:hypothetical protein
MVRACKRCFEKCFSNVRCAKKKKNDLDRKSLETIYFSFIRPKLEYASHVWDNCNKRDSDELEKFQLDIARTGTGGRKGTCHELLYQETNWPTLSDQRKDIKLKNFVKIVDNKTPPYLRDLLPAKVGDIRPTSRNVDNFYVPKARTENFKNSFISVTVKLWNNIPLSERTIEVVKQKSRRTPNKLYYVGERHINVKHAQLRMQCSKLNAHLFSLHVTDSPQCACGNNLEDNSHFLLHCPIYLTSRQKMLQALQTVINVNNCMLILCSLVLIKIRPSSR